MPRNVGTGLYTYPDGTPGNPGQTIFSARYNTFINDLSNTLNQALPINMGGTGANNATAALFNLGGETAAQLVTNYDTQLWAPGSFRSAIGATAAPNTTDAFAGVVYISELLASPPTNQNVVVEARSMVNGKLYVRRKNAGAWGVWEAQDADYVNVTGDTMSGNLTIGTGGTGTVAPSLTFNGGTAAGGGAHIVFNKNATSRWVTGFRSSIIGGSASDNFMAFNSNLGTAAIELGATDNSITLSGQIIAVANTTHNIGSGTTAATAAAININGGSGTNGGSHVIFAKNSVSKWVVGTRSSILGGTSDNLVIYNGSNGGIPIESNTSNNTTIAGHLTVQPSPVSLPGGTYTIAMGFPSGEFGIGIKPMADNAYHMIFFNTAGTQIGSIFTTPTVTQFNTSSDERLKTDLKSFDAGNIVDNTNVYDFAWKSTGERSYGVIAQQANTVYPAAVNYSKEADAWGIDYSKYVPVILQELKALRARVAELEAKATA